MGNDVISCDMDHQKKKNHTDAEFREIKGVKEESEPRRVSLRSGARHGGRDKECCSVIDFRVVVLLCYCSDADQIKCSR